MTCTVCAMFSSVVPHSCLPSLEELCSQGFCDPGAACRSMMMPSLYFSAHLKALSKAWKEPPT
uniref:Uncharacterized protein n=1 Tax=Arundo donax TaxID=35708 RepID=A0A0A8Z0K4_ARUDO